MPNKKPKNIEWLQKLRFNSWELEILLVGFVLVVLFRVPQKIQELSTYKIFYNSTLSHTPDFIINHMITPIFSVGIYIMVHVIIISLILYLILRGFWIAIIGLTSAFPNGINLISLNFYKKYEERLLATNFEKISMSLDKICSSIFAFAFLVISLIIMFFMIILYFLILFTFGLSIVEENLILLFVIIIPYIFFSLTYIFDIVTLSFLKKIKWKYFAIPYYKFYIIYNFITLGFIFEKLYFYFISNLSKKSIFSIIILIILLSQIANLSTSQEYYLFSDKISHKKSMSYHFYEDKINYNNKINSILDSDFAIPRIQSFVINDGIIELFIPYESLIDNVIKSHCNINYDKLDSSSQEKNIGATKTTAFLKLGPDSNNNSYPLDKVLDCVNDFYQVYIDNTNKIRSNFLFYIHPILNQKGYYTILNISGIAKGDHYLKIQLNPEFPLDKYGQHIIKHKDGGMVAIKTEATARDIYDDDYSISIPFYNNRK